MKTIVFVLGLVLINFHDLYSQGIPYNQEFLVNTYTESDQILPAISAFSDHKFVVTWTSFGPDGSRSGVVGQIFDLAGAKNGLEFQVNTYTIGIQTNASVAKLSDGGFVVCWESQGQDGFDYGVFSQLFDSTGAKKGEEFQVNSYDSSNQKSSSVAGLKDGSFVVCWESYRYDGIDWRWFVDGQLFEASGAKIGNEFQVHTDMGYDQFSSTVAALADGGFVVCWTSGLYNRDIAGQIFNGSGTRRGNQFWANSYMYEDQINSAIAALANGDFVVCWESPLQDGDGYGIFGQIFDAAGVKKGSEFQVNTGADKNQWNPSIAALSDGGFVVCWNSEDQAGIAYCILGQLFDGAGTKQEGEFLVNATRYHLASAAIACLPDYRWVVCWPSYQQDASGADILGKFFLNTPIIHQLNTYSLIEPVNDATLNTTCPCFRWRQPSAIQECYSYEIIFDLYLDTDINFSNPKIINDIQDTTYRIDSLTAGKTYFWKVLSKNLAGDSLWSAQQDWGFFIKQGATLVTTGEQSLHTDFKLCQNYPNPFNSKTEIKYSLPRGKASYQVQLEIFDVLGHLVQILLAQEQGAGDYGISWDGTDLGGNRVASGIYFYSLEAGELKSIRKMLVLQ